PATIATEARGPFMDVKCRASHRCRSASSQRGRGRGRAEGTVVGELLEREAERGAIGALLVGAWLGAGRMLLIEGPAGIGKGSLPALARTRATAAGLTVIAARGGELERSLAFRRHTTAARAPAAAFRLARPSPN